MVTARQGDRERGRSEEAGGGEGVRLWRSPLLSRFRELTHGLSLRTGGVSAPPFDSLNVALHVGDEVANVLGNRRRVAEGLGADLRNWVCAQQVHGDRVHCVTAAEVGRGALSYDTAIPETDALVTAAPNLVLTLFVADCAPVFLYDPQHRAFGVAHAGWRSLAAGIVPKTVEKMQAYFGTRTDQLFAAVGPSLGPCCFEVGPEVAGQFDPSHLVRQPDGTRPHLDPCSVIRRQLVERGVPSERLDAAPPCTKCQQSDYFSHRGSGGSTGRAVALLTTTPPE
jgi:YfiH family protein